MNRDLIPSTAFLRSVKKLAKRQPAVANAVRDTMQALRADAFDPKLRTHKLQGELAGSWACSADYDLRIVFDFVDHEGSEAILLLSVGNHDEVY